MSRGRMRTSSSSVSSLGTISMMSLPGCTTPPTVLLNRVLTVPRTGAHLGQLDPVGQRQLALAQRGQLVLVSDSSLRAWLRIFSSDSSILLWASLMEAWMRSIWASAPFCSPQ